ncbi:MAG: thioredoxin family protein [Gammaproteobacteria bacterium]|nr:thioredoxin family protein [Gammaproteobacteria bacterium]
MKKLIFLLFLLTGMITPLHAGHLKQVKDLRVEFHNANKAGLPLLILFSAEECEYCEYIKENFLIPMQKDSAYADKVIIREIKTESYFNVIDASGIRTTADQIAMRYDADVSPTIIFMDSKGQELSRKIIGISAPDYFDTLLDDAINESLHKLAN